MIYLIGVALVFVGLAVTAYIVFSALIENRRVESEIVRRAVDR